MSRSRKKSNKLAKTILDTGATVTDADILSVLRLWRLHRNKICTNVMHKKQTLVYNDKLGFVRSRSGKFCFSKSIEAHPEFMQPLHKWIRDAQPAEL